MGEALIRRPGARGHRGSRQSLDKGDRGAAEGVQPKTSGIWSTTLKEFKLFKRNGLVSPARDKGSID